MNNRYAYALLFDRDDEVDYKKLHNQIVSLDCILNWFHYIKSSYILVSDKPSAHSLDREIQKIFHNKDYMLISINLEECEGWLPEKAWKWIQRQSIQ